MHYRIRATALIVLCACFAAATLTAAAANKPPTRNKPATASKIIFEAPKIVIHGVIDAQTNSVAGLARFTLSKAVAEASVLPKELTLKGNNQIKIQPTNIEVTSIAVNTERKQQVTITVKAIPQPGTYEGELIFLVDSDQTPIPLEVNVSQKPLIAYTVTPMNLKAVHYQVPGIDRLLAKLLLPYEMTHDEWPVPIDNQSPFEAAVVSKSVFLFGDKRGDALGSGQIQVQGGDKLPTGPGATLSLKVTDLNQLSPDSYKGKLQLKAKDPTNELATTALETPINLSVRSGPFFVLLTIIAGIFAGMILRKTDTPQAVKEARLLPRLQQLARKAENLKNISAQVGTRNRLKSIQTAIESPTDTEEDVAKEIQKVDTLIDFLASLETLEAALENPKLDGLKREMMPKIDESRQNALKDKTAEALALRDEVETRILAFLQDASMGGGVTDVFSNVIKWMKKSGDELTRLDIERPAPKQVRTSALVSVLSGVKFVSPSDRFRFLRPLVFFLLLVLLILLGFETLYVTSGATFGDDGFYDYLALFIWGFSAEVTRDAIVNATKK